MSIKFPALNHEKNMSMKIVSVFKNMLIDGRIKPGDKLPTEAELVQQLGVSRTPLREAIKILEAIGIIKIKRGEGMYICKEISNSHLNPMIFSIILHSKNTDKLIEFRQYFESMVLEMVSKNGTLDDLQKIKQVYEWQVDTANQSEHFSYAELAEIDLQFHYAVIEATKNPFVIEIGKTIYELSKHKIAKLAEQYGIEQTLNTHKTYVDALFNKNGNKNMEVKEKIKSNWKSLGLE